MAHLLRSRMPKSTFKYCSIRDVLGDTLGNSLGSEFLFRRRAVEVAAK